MLKRLMIAIFAVIMIFALTACNTSSDSHTVVVNAVAGGSSGSWYTTLAAMSELVNGMENGVQMKVMPGGGLSNPGTISSGEYQVGWVHSVLGRAAFEGNAPFAEACPGLRSLAAGFTPHMVQITALSSSGINSFEEIFEKQLPVRFCTGIQSTITGWLFGEVLAYYGYTADDIASWGGKVIYTEYGDWVNLAQDNQIDVMFDVIGVPASTTQEILTSTELVFLSPSDDLAQHLIDNYGFLNTTIDSDIYSALEADVPTVGTGIELAVNADVDDEVVYKLLECLEAKENDIIKIHRSLSDFRIEAAWKNTGLQLHPAAEKFYKDRGYFTE